jgi:putative transposase
LAPETKRELLEPAHPQISIARQCALVGLPRSTSYYQAQGERVEKLTVLRLLDQPYTDTPYYSIRRMTAWWRSQGYAVNHKRGARLLRIMGVETIYPKPRMREPHPAHRVYPYVLRGVPITRVNQVWSTASTSMRLHGGLMSQVAVMDWCRRYVLSWAVSMTMDVGLCLEALDQALGVARPAIFHSDQGAQCTSLDCTGCLASVGIQISMDGRGRALDNVFIERLGRTLKYEEVDVKDDETPAEAMQGWAQFFVRDKEWRQHQALGYRTPAAVYFGSSV